MGFRGMKKAMGFPVDRTMAYVRKALMAGYSAALLAEGGPGKFVKNRYVAELYGDF